MRAEAIAREELAALERSGLLRTLTPLESPQGPEVVRAGRRYVNFCSNDYLSLAGHPAIAGALQAASKRFGVGSGASRLVAGDTLAHRSLEAALAGFSGSLAATLFGNGFAANLGILGSLCGPRDVVLSDELNHASLVDGCRLSRAQVVVYPHADVEALERGLREASSARRRLVASDAVFSMNGDPAPLEAIVDLAERHDAMVLVDEAHAMGVFGPRGEGLCAELGIASRVDVRMGTLSKALGGYGAWAASGEATAHLLVNRARSLVFSTALPAALCAAGEAAVALARGGAALRRALWRNVTRFAAGLARLGLPAADRSPIFPVIVGEPSQALAMSDELLARGVFVRAIRPPAVPAGTSRLRFSVCAGHTDQHIDCALGALAEVLDRRRDATAACSL